MIFNFNTVISKICAHGIEEGSEENLDPPMLSSFLPQKAHSNMFLTNLIDRLSLTERPLSKFNRAIIENSMQERSGNCFPKNEQQDIAKRFNFYARKASRQNVVDEIINF